MSSVIEFASSIHTLVEVEAVIGVLLTYYSTAWRQTNRLGQAKHSVDL